jgi:serine/threonine protein kinase/Tfp pilus assembly protein PilF
VAIECPKCHSENAETSLFCSGCGTKLAAAEEFSLLQTETLRASLQELNTGSTFAGRYQVIEELGKGGMGKVYKVFDNKIKEKIALKLIKPEIASNRETLERFSNELKLARKIRHKNVCGMFDISEAEGAHFITMEYVSGEDLKTMIRMSGTLGIGTVLSVGKQICNGLTEAHSQGIVHRDLKPTNVMIDKGGNVKIMDFGIARSLRERGITGPSILIGTPEYMSPEQAEAKEVDQRSDIYSLGIVLYEMATGRVPFEGETALSIAMKHKGESPKNPKQLNPNIPDDLSGVILKCLEKDKSKRYQTAAEIHLELEKIEKGIPTTERIVPERKAFTSRQITVQFDLKKLLLPALAVLAVIIAVFAAWKLIPKKQTVLPPQIENSIAVISFENQTGDKAYDYLQKAIPNLLITSLEQTGLLNVASWERMHDLLKQMGKPNVEMIDRDMGFELCRREGIKAIVLGVFTKGGDVFATDAKVYDVESKRLLKSASSKGKGTDSILENQIDALSRQVSQGIGLSEKAAEMVQSKVEDVTTKSFEAYKYFLSGREDYERFYYESARQSLERAVGLDPSFALAYRYLAYAQRALGNTLAFREAIEKAKRLSNRVTERERLYIEAGYARSIEENPQKAFAILKQLVEKYPKEKRAVILLSAYLGTLDEKIEQCKKALELDPQYGIALNDLGYHYLAKNNYELALEYFNRYAAASPGDANPIDSIGEVYFLMGKLDESIAKYKEAIADKPDFYMSMLSIQYVYALKEDYAEAQKWVDQSLKVAPSPVIKGAGHLWRAFYLFWLGGLDESFTELQRAADVAQTDWTYPASASLLRALAYFDRGEIKLSRQFWDIALEAFVHHDPDNNNYYKIGMNWLLGLIELKEQKIDTARASLAEMKSLFPQLTDQFQRQFAEMWMGSLEAEIMIADGSLERALVVYDAISLPEFRLSGSSTGLFLNYQAAFFRDLRARVYQQKRDVDKAIAEYERLTTFDPKNPQRYLVHPKYHYRLAKLYERKGLRDKARDRYQKFLDLWKDADPGLPEVEDARKRLAGLKGD